MANSGDVDSTGEGVSKSTASWLTHRLYIAPNTVKRHKVTQNTNNFVNKTNTVGYRVGNNVNYNFNDEYDPRYPNEYEKVTKLLSIKSHTKVPQPIQLTPNTLTQTPLSGIILLHHLLTVGDEMLKLRLEAMEKSEVYTETPSTQSLPVTSQPKKPEQPVALKMMEKMGWKGQGLGKNEQGMVTPLVAKSIGKKSAIIINAPNKPVSVSIPNTNVSKGLNTMEKVEDEVNIDEKDLSRICIIIFKGNSKVDLDELEEILTEFGTIIDIKLLSEKMCDRLLQDQRYSEVVWKFRQDSSIVVCEYETEEQSKRLFLEYNNKLLMESSVSILFLSPALYTQL
ncbi:RNA binding protein, putative [Theileria annulata]|uniref:RNA binding protein, putative n=1 Tax=Theileria annulata TaxID=5874 RepID=Q4UI46_THEAN|nr:RNA binding protein, putative [Theileria annulata]CAI73243.1 RNA binding protein, putative [Theileria annulata]|eukprot:XP_953920.1 RNA binding protein, putative [Theileria annulata]